MIIFVANRFFLLLHLWSSIQFFSLELKTFSTMSLWHFWLCRVVFCIDEQSVLSLWLFWKNFTLKGEFEKNQKFFHLCQLADSSKTTDVVFNVEVHRFWNKRARIVIGFTSFITVRISCSLLLEKYMINEESNLFFLFESWKFVKCKPSSSKRLMISCHPFFVLAGGRIEFFGNALKTYLFKWWEHYN